MSRACEGEWGRRDGQRIARRELRAESRRGVRGAERSRARKVLRRQQRRRHFEQPLRVADAEGRPAADGGEAGVGQRDHPVLHLELQLLLLGLLREHCALRLRRLLVGADVLRGGDDDADALDAGDGGERDARAVELLLDVEEEESSQAEDHSSRYEPIDADLSLEQLTELQARYDAVYTSSRGRAKAPLVRYAFPYCVSDEHPKVYRHVRGLYDKRIHVDAQETRSGGGDGKGGGVPRLVERAARHRPVGLCGCRSRHAGTR